MSLTGQRTSVGPANTAKIPQIPRSWGRAQLCEPQWLLGLR